MLKLVQRQTYDFFTQKYAIAGCFIGLTVVVISAFSFGEVLLGWSKEKYSEVYSFYSDNLKERSLQSKLCQYLPIDVVYTWVNGSDPVFLASLDSLQAEIENQESAKNVTKTKEKCPFAPCLNSHMVVIRPSLPLSTTITVLAKIEPLFQSAFKMSTKRSHVNQNQNVSLVSLESIEEAQRCVSKGYLFYDGTNHSIGPGYLTTDWMAQNTVLLDDTLIITGIPLIVIEGQLIDKIPKRLQPLISKVFLVRERGMAIVTVAHTMALESLLLLEGNFTFGYRDPSFGVASLVLDFPHQSRANEEIGRSRFEDNEELRYSLRSLEKHAPWVRNIYIVTNGQIPYWINLDNPRISIVTHEEIFVNTSHLPTFSSPAIETHLHRIKGLSRKFLYLNDDVMFGRDVWPDDFYTHADGQKVYLAWSVPDCREGCPNSWIGDGYCDRGCNNSDCQHDGGDCLGDTHGAADGGAASSDEFDVWQDELEKMYCQPNCATMWIADKYCDMSCNVKECAFDGGDCGVEEYHRMVSIQLDEAITEYAIPQGTCQMYFNLSRLLEPDRMVQNGWFEAEPGAGVRTVALNQKSKVLTLLFNENRFITMVISLQGIRANHKFVFTFNVTANTTATGGQKDDGSRSGYFSMVKSVGNLRQFQSSPAATLQTSSSLRSIRLHSLEAFQQEYPHARSLQEDWPDWEKSPYADINETTLELPTDLLRNLTLIKTKLIKGYFTIKGARKAKARLLRKYFDSLSTQRPAVYTEVISSRLPSNQKMRNFGIGNRHLEVSIRPSPKSTVPSELVQSQSNRLDTPRSNGDGLRGGIPRGRFPLRGLLGVNEMLQKFKYGIQPKDKSRTHQESISTATTGRRLLDTFGDSLRFANRLLNSQFGFEARKVPAHMAHMIDRDVMSRLQDRFPEAFDDTSAHKIRNAEDVQLAFAYFYFLMSEKSAFDPSALFDEFDTDSSGTLADRELRTLLARLHGLPVTYEKMKQLENVIANCSFHLPAESDGGPTAPPFEHYLDSNTPIVGKALVLGCEPLLDLLGTNLKEKKKYPFEIVGDEEVAFKMIHINISQVVKQLDDIRARPRKFICLNDNIDHWSPEVATVKAILVDFYESLFPKASQFELPPLFRNRFLHVAELKAWRRYRGILRAVTYSALAILMAIALASYFHHRIAGIWKNLFPGRSVRNRTTTI